MTAEKEIEEKQPTLHDLFKQTKDGDEIERSKMVKKGTLEYKAVADRKKADMEVSSEYVLSKKARGMKNISYPFKVLSFVGSSYSLFVEIQNSFTTAMPIFIGTTAIGIALLIEFFLHFETSSMFNIKEIKKTRVVGMTFWIIALAFNMLMHLNTTLILGDTYKTEHSSTITTDLQTPEAIAIRANIATLNERLARAKNTLNEKIAMDKLIRDQLLVEKNMITNSNEWCLSMHQSKRDRCMDRQDEITESIEGKDVKVKPFEKSVADIENQISTQNNALAKLANKEIEGISQKGDRAMYVALALLIMIEVMSRADLYANFINRNNLPKEVLEMTKQVFSGMGMVEQLEEIFYNIDERIKVLTGNYSRLSNEMISGQSETSNLALLGIASQRQEARRATDLIVRRLEAPNGGTAYHYKHDGQTEMKEQSTLDEELQILKEMAGNYDVKIIFDPSILGAKLEGSVIIIQQNLVFDEKVENLKHELAHFVSGDMTHGEKFQNIAKNFGLNVTQHKINKKVVNSLLDMYDELIYLSVGNSINLNRFQPEEIQTLVNLKIIEDGKLLIPQNIALERLLDARQP